MWVSVARRKIKGRGSAGTFHCLIARTRILGSSKVKGEWFLFLLAFWLWLFFLWMHQRPRPLVNLQGWWKPVKVFLSPFAHLLSKTHEWCNSTIYFCTLRGLPLSSAEPTGLEESLQAFLIRNIQPPLCSTYYWLPDKLPWLHVERTTKWWLTNRIFSSFT